MTEVVGLRYVDEGLPEVLNRLRSYKQAQEQIQRVNQTVANNRQFEVWLRQQRGALQAVQQQMERTAGASTRLAATQQVYGRAALQAADLTGRLRNQFLATANTIAILDGPLGGIASRFSAFGVLLGRTGLLLGAAAVAMTALVTVAGRGVRAFSQFEVETAKINAALTATGNAAGLTGQEVERMASRIALATLESEQGVRQAATRLLTFRDVAGEVFEDVLKAATDMAALGFGTVESEAVKLAKALEDPAQALTSLSRAGIVFTRQQRAMIISMVESGDRLGAMERILDNVNRRVGGAAEAAARDTFAGSMDTIGQAAGRAVRDLGRFVVEVSGLGGVVSRIASSLSDYAAGAETTSQMLARLRNEQAAATSELERAERRRLVLVGPQREYLTGLRSEIEARERNIERLTEQVRQERALAQARQQQGQVERRREGIDNLQGEIDLRQRLIGLTEDQQRVTRAFAAEGLLINQEQINRMVDDYADSLRAAGVDAQFVAAASRRHRDELEGIADLAERYTRSLSDARDVTAALRAAEALTERNALIQAQIGYLQQGVSATEARARAEDDVTRAMFQSVLAAEGLPPEVRKAVEEAIRLVDAARDAQAQLDGATNSANALASALANAANTSLGLSDRIAGLRARVDALRSGADQYTANARQSLELERRRLDVVIRTGDAAQRIEATAQRGIIAAQLNELADLERTNAELGRSGRGGGGGGSTRDPSSVMDAINQMAQEAQRTEHLLSLDQQRRQEMEIFYRLKDANDKADIRMTDDRLMRYAQELALSQQRIEAMRDEQRMAQTLGQALGGLFTSAVNGASAFRQALAGLLHQLARMLANRAFTSLLSGGLDGGGGFLSSIARGWSVLMDADGNAFSNGNVIPFAAGGVVNRPTTFPMRGGQTGLMGEAGPEAIMPLKRGRNGQLGVQADAGMQRVQIELVVHAAEGVTVEQVGQIAAGVSVRPVQTATARNRQVLPRQLDQISSRGR